MTISKTDSQNVIHSIEDFKRVAGATVTFLGKCANFEPSQHNLAMEKLFAHTKVVLNSIRVQIMVYKFSVEDKLQETLCNTLPNRILCSLFVSVLLKLVPSNNLKIVLICSI